MSVIDEIRRSKHVSLVTYRRDGTGVATPVWHVTEGNQLLVVSEAKAWKVKRVRNTGRAQVTVCDIRGRVAPGAASAEGEARLLDEAGTAAAREKLARKYLTSRLGNGFARLLHLRRPPMVAIAVTL
ncbi:PPOX class F420-dependent oxidoreductase [Asanoa sp. NPDC049518]|uniref:PPOX class F420-dependent oxidoreductase n=1 Tax=unclassified Asanoa TaxID=2685164 RepID=UPI00343BAEE8